MSTYPSRVIGRASINVELIHIGMMVPDNGLSIEDIIQQSPQLSHAQEPTNTPLTMAWATCQGTNFAEAKLLPRLLLFRSASRFSRIEGNEENSPCHSCESIFARELPRTIATRSAMACNAP